MIDGMELGTRTKARELELGEWANCRAWGGDLESYVGFRTTTSGRRQLVVTVDSRGRGTCVGEILHLESLNMLLLALSWSVYLDLL